MTTSTLVLLLPSRLAVCLFAAAMTAQAPAPSLPNNSTTLPVREVTVFKDGHAYLIREQASPGAGRRQVVLDELPQPVLGTFWPYATGGARLVSAKAARQEVEESIAAQDLAQFARGNLGKDVTLVDTTNARVHGRLLDVASTPGAAAHLPQENILLIATANGTRMLPMAQLREFEIKGELQRKFTQKTQQERLTLDVDGGDDGAAVGVMYVQRGLRWIPAYRIDIDGEGKAKVQLQATLVNDLIDLDRTTVHLVIGVPKFEFAGLVDPIALQNEVAQVATRTRDSRLSNMLSNSLMTQSAGYQVMGESTQDAQPTVEGGQSNEDLFVFTIKDVSLKVGERLVVPIETFELTYRDVYKLEVDFAPPMEVRQNLQSQQVLELAKELAAPKAEHVLRIVNGSKVPLTTAPALVLRNGRILAQGRMRYTPIGAETDLAINTAIDICVTIEEHETGRKPNAENWAGNAYGRIELAGTIALRNDKNKAVEIEVRRRVLGIADSVGQDGKQQQLDLVGLWGDNARPAWWGWWSWPYWWFHFNGFGEFRWTVQLQPRATTTLQAGWHYFWR